MKNLKKLILASILLIGVTEVAKAQNKIAHISIQELIEAMPEFKTAQAELKKLGETYEEDIKKTVKELKEKVTLYDQQAATQTAEENNNRMKEVDNMQKNIAKFQQQAQKDLSEKEFTLLKPITDKAKAAIEKVASNQGYEYVLEAGGLIVAKGKDLIVDVKAELGI